MSYIKTDTFVDIAIECDQDPKKIIEHIQQTINPNYASNVTQVRNRINNYKRKGLLPLSSGNTVDSGQFLKGTSTLYGANGEIKQQWVKTDSAKENALEAFQVAIENILTNTPFLPLPSITLPETTDEDLLTIYPIGDAHVGMLAHAAETGKDHDLNISKTNHIKAIKLAVDKATPSKEAFIIDTGDWFHADDSNNRTPRGNNPLDVDGRYHKVIQTGFEIAETMILAALSKHEIVHWRSAEGNHNTHSAIMLSYYLRGRFKGTEYEDRVIVHCSPSMFFYHQFGSNLIGITHGHTAKPANLPGIMATDVPKMWGDTTHRYWYCGHIHHDVQKEMPGCKLETFRTLASKDAWHYASGYRSDQDLKSITLHKKYGEIERNTFNISLIDDK